MPGVMTFTLVGIGQGHDLCPVFTHIQLRVDLDSSTVFIFNSNGK